MNLTFPEEYSKSSSDDEIDTGLSGRSYECIFCKRGFSTAQALGGHMNIHRKDKARNKPTFPLSTSSEIPLSQYYPFSPVGNNNTNYYSSTSTIPEGADHAITNNHHHQVYFPATASHVLQYNEVLCVEKQQDHWRQQRNLSYPFCVVGKIKDKFEDKDGLDLELRLGRHP